MYKGNQSYGKPEGKKEKLSESLDHKKAPKKIHVSYFWG